MRFERKTVEGLFTASNRYRVPNYQRGYAWKVNLQLSDFWSDIASATESDPLYLGTLILQKNQDEETGNYWNIVDGQQRITTISLLLVACRNLAAQNAWPQAATLSQILAFHNIATGETSGLRVHVGQNISGAYEHIVQNPEWDETSFPQAVDKRKARILKTNYAFLKNQIKSYSQTDLAELLKKLLAYSFFLVVEVDEALQAFDIFERNNGRGAPLNIADLLKNKLFANADEIPNLSDRWDKIVTESDTMLPRVLKYFDSLRNGHDTSRTVLFPHLRRQVQDLTPPIFMNEIETFAKFFNSVTSHKFTADPSHRISSASEFNFLYLDESFFKRVKRSLDALALFRVYIAFPVIYAGLLALRRFYEPNSKPYATLKSEFKKMLSTIECFHFINNQISTAPTNRPEQLYAVLAKEISAATTAAECKASIKAVREGLRNINIVGPGAFEEDFIKITYLLTYDKSEIAYIFDRFNQDPFVEDPIVAIFDPQAESLINRTYEVEHIAPVSSWEGDSEVLNNIGNLVVITKQTNRSVSSDELKSKVDIYESRHCDNLRPLKDLVEFIEREKAETMSPALIEMRARELARTAYEEVWNPWR